MAERDPVDLGKRLALARTEYAGPVHEVCTRGLVLARELADRPSHRVGEEGHRVPAGQEIGFAFVPEDRVAVVRQGEVMRLSLQVAKLPPSAALEVEGPDLPPFAVSEPHDVLDRPDDLVSDHLVHDLDGRARRGPLDAPDALLIAEKNVVRAASEAPDRAPSNQCLSVATVLVGHEDPVLRGPDRLARARGERERLPLALGDLAERSGAVALLGDREDQPQRAADPEEVAATGGESVDRAGEHGQRAQRSA